MWAGLDWGFQEVRFSEGVSEHAQCGRHQIWAQTSVVVLTTVSSVGREELHVNVNVN